MLQSLKCSSALLAPARFTGITAFAFKYRVAQSKTLSARPFVRAMASPEESAAKQAIDSG